MVLDPIQALVDLNIKTLALEPQKLRVVLPEGRLMCCSLLLFISFIEVSHKVAVQIFRIKIISCGLSEDHNDQ